MARLTAVHERQHRLAVGGAGDGPVDVVAEAGAVVQQGVHQQGVAGCGPVEGAAHPGRQGGTRLRVEEFADAPLRQRTETGPAVRSADEFGVSGRAPAGAGMAGCGAHHEDGPEAAPAQQMDDGAQGCLVHEVGVVHGHHQGAVALREPQQRLCGVRLRTFEARSGSVLRMPGECLCVYADPLRGVQRKGLHLTVAQ